MSLFTYFGVNKTATQPASKKLNLHVSLNKLALYKLFKYGISNKLYVRTFLVKVDE